MSFEIENWQQKPYRQWLLENLLARKQRNPRYSLRAYSQFLKVNKTTLSEVLNFRRHLSEANASQIAKRLGLSPAQREKLLREVRGVKGRQESTDQGSPYQMLEEDQFRLISDWYHFAVMNLARIPKVRYCPEQVAKRLGIEKWQAQLALERLQRLGYVTNLRGFLKRTSGFVHSSNDIPSEAVRIHHAQNLKLAERALEDVPVALRDFNSVTMAIDTDRIVDAKKEIARFKQRLSKLLTDGKPREVYTLAVQLFPAKGDQQ